MTLLKFARGFLYAGMLWMMFIAVVFYVQWWQAQRPRAVVKQRVQYVQTVKVHQP